MSAIFNWIFCLIVCSVYNVQVTILDPRVTLKQVLLGLTIQLNR